MATQLTKESIRGHVYEAAENRRFRIKQQKERARAEAYQRKQKKRAKIKANPRKYRKYLDLDSDETVSDVSSDD